MNSLPYIIPQQINTGRWLVGYSLNELKAQLKTKNIVLPICSLGTPVEKLLELAPLVLPPLYHEAMDAELKSQLVARIGQCFPFYETTCDRSERQYEFEIVGVVEDIHQTSLHTNIDPLMFQLGRGERYQFMILDAELSNFQNLISDLRGQWVGQEINTPFEYFTLNENLQVLYESDFKTFNLIKYFGIISVIISGLGLYALSMFMAVRRFKEIGVRKVLGAKVSDILIMVSADLSKLIFIAFIISIPLTILGMNKWLETFAYRITPGVGTYLVAGIVSILIGWMAISYQSIKAALTNPVNILRDE